MKRIYLAMVIASLLVIGCAFGINAVMSSNDDKLVRVGVVYVGDRGTAYTDNIVRGMDVLEDTYGDRVEIISKYNVAEGNEDSAIMQLIKEDCDIIFGTSFGYGETMKEIASQYPDIQFCQATCSNANDAPVVSNYHNFMGEVYEGRYASGVVAGMKLKELIDNGKITIEQAKIGYVAAYPYAEVISGYTAFFLGVRSVVPEAVMSVVYTNSWSNYAIEKQQAERLISEGCVIISQHSDTSGVAAACENTDDDVEVYCVSYNRNMMNIAPTTYLTGCRMNWSDYVVSAVGAVLDGKKIESRIDGDVYGNDAAAGFSEGWVEMLVLNERVAAEGTAEKLEEIISKFKKGKINVFKGDYIGIDPFDENDVYDLNKEYKENEYSSAPTFHYVLQDVITVLE